MDFSLLPLNSFIHMCHQHTLAILYWIFRAAFYSYVKNMHIALRMSVKVMFTIASVKSRHFECDTKTTKYFSSSPRCVFFIRASLPQNSTRECHSVSTIIFCRSEKWKKLHRVNFWYLISEERKIVEKVFFSLIECQF
jgi:hypothetical protein